MTCSIVSLSQHAYIESHRFSQRVKKMCSFQLIIVIRLIDRDSLRPFELCYCFKL